MRFAGPARHQTASDHHFVPPLRHLYHPVAPSILKEKLYLNQGPMEWTLCGGMKSPMTRMISVLPTTRLSKRRRLSARMSALPLSRRGGGLLMLGGPDSLAAGKYDLAAIKQRSRQAAEQIGSRQNSAEIVEALAPLFENT